MLDPEFDTDAFPSYVTDGVSDIDGGMPRQSVLPCSIRMDDFSTNMAKARKGPHSNDEFVKAFARRKVQMKRWLEDSYDYTLIDCPPSMALQVKVLLSVADSYIIPAIPDRLSVRGSLHLVSRIRSHNFKIPGLGTLWSLFRVQNKIHGRFIEMAEEGKPPLDLLPPAFDTVIPNAAKIAESTEPGQKPKSFRQKYT